jgi:hemoglobin
MSSPVSFWNLPGRAGEEEIAHLVDAFYARVRQDERLGPIFERAVGDEWEPHLKRMRAFWSSLMLASGRYKGNPMVAHLELMPQIGMAHFERWLELWRETAAEILPPAEAVVFIRRAEGIAERLLAAIDQHHASLMKPTGPEPDRDVEGY